MTAYWTICEKCGEEIPNSEAQCCELCGRDGLGNCCIAPIDHDCDCEDSEE